MIDKNLKSIKYWNWLCCFSMLMLGMYIAAYQNAVPQIKSDYNLNEFNIGIMIALHFLGSLLFPMILGNIADKKGLKPVLILCFAGYCLGLISIILFANAVVLCISTFLIGGTFAVIEGSMSGLLSSINPSKEHRMMNLSQMCFCFGAVLSPILMSLKPNYSFKFGYSILFCGMIIGFILISVPKLPYLQQNESVTEKESKLNLKSLFLILLLVSMAIYVGIEEGIVFFAGSFMETKTIINLKPEYFISVYWLGMGLSRLAFSFLKKKLQFVMLSFLACCAALLTLTIVLDNEYILLLCYFLMGTAIAPIWSHIMVLGTVTFKKLPNTVANGLMSAGALGGAIMPLLLGAISQNAGIVMAFILIITLVIVLLFILIALIKKRVWKY